MVLLYSIDLKIASFENNFFHFSHKKEPKLLNFFNNLDSTFIYVLYYLF